MKLAFEEAVAGLVRSPKFRAWGRLTLDGLVQSDITAVEKHYTPDELGTLWGVAPQTIRNLFDTEPGVLRIPSQRPGKKARKYVSMKIPESIAERVHKKYSAVPL